MAVRAARVQRWLALGSVMASTFVVTMPASARAPDASALPTPAAAIRTAALDTDGVRSYWTPSRMEAAVPLGLDVDGNHLAAAPPASSTPRAKAAALTAPRTVGKLFFTTNEGDAQCSAAALNSPGRNVVITAGHCANDGPGLLGPTANFRNFLFVPRYARGSAPDGRWVGTKVALHNAWVRSADTDYDQAVLTVAPIGGRNLVDVVGGNGLALNYPVRQNEVRVWGWPAEAPYDGETVRRCSGITGTYPGTGDAQINCTMNGGASGGPWMLSMTSANAGFIWAVTSRRTLEGRARLVARPLTSAVLTLVSAVRSRPVVSPARRPAARSTVPFKAYPADVGRGQLLRLKVKVPAGGKATLQLRYSSRSSWATVSSARAGSTGVLEFRFHPTRVGWSRYRVVTTRGTSTRSVLVHHCPFPVSTSRAVVSATRCTAPVG